MTRSNFMISDTDYNGDEIRINCEGVDDHKLAHFGGLDLHVKAARTLISATYSPMSFPEKDGDYDISTKVIGLLLNEIGELIRNTSLDSEFLEGTSNLELVKNYLEYLPENQVVNKLIEEDNLLIQKYKEQSKREEDEIWTNIDADLKKRRE